MHSQCQFQRAQKASKISGALGEMSRVPAIGLGKIYRLPGLVCGGA